jgi:hypothetical protein
MRNVILVLGLLLALSAANAAAENTAPKIDSTRHALDVYDNILLPKDRKVIESLISGIEIGLVWANARLKQQGQPHTHSTSE